MALFDFLEAMLPIRQLQNLAIEVGEEVFAELGGAAYVAAADVMKVKNKNRSLKPLDAFQKGWLRSNFGSLVDKVRVIYGAVLIPSINVDFVSLNTSTKAQTFGNRVYLKSSYKPGDIEQLVYLAHEMVHVRQFHQHGESFYSFGKAYFRGFYQAGFSYAKNPMEAEAFEFENCFLMRVLSPIEVPEVWRSQWTTGWSSFMPFLLNNAPHYLAYKVNDGVVNIDRLRPDGQGVDTIWSPPAGKRWTRGWSSFVPFVLNGMPHYLACKVASGEVDIDRIRSDGQGVDTIWEGQWTGGWTSFVPFDLNGMPHYLAYKLATGEVDIDRVRPDGRGVETIWEATWTKGWTNFAPFHLNGVPHYLAYKVGTGEVDIDRIRPTGIGVDTVGEAQWKKGWTSIVSFLFNGEPHLLSYKGPMKWLGLPYAPIGPDGSGYVHIDRVLPDGSGTDTIWCDQWTGGWTSFLPFTSMGQAFHLTYKAKVGTAAIDIVKFRSP